MYENDKTKQTQEIAENEIQNLFPSLGGGGRGTERPETGIIHAWGSQGIVARPSDVMGPRTSRPVLTDAMGVDSSIQLASAYAAKI